jgi:hypothetical protein
LHDRNTLLTYNLPSFSHHRQTKNMYSTMIRIQLISGLLLILATTTLAAADEPRATIPQVDVEQLSATETYQKWGQVLFCQRTYTLPEVRSRLYDFDVKHCDQAALLAADVISKYSEQDQQQLKIRAERHAKALSYNTSEPYHAVGACREYCRKLAEFREQRNDK